MPLQDQTVPVSFSKGLNTKVDPKQTLMGELLNIQNGVFTQVNAVSEDPGSLPIPSTIFNTVQSLSNGNSLNIFNGVLVETDGQYLYTFSESNQNWSQYPTKVALSISSSAVGANTGNVSNVGVARSSNGLEFYTYGLADVVNGSPYPVGVSCTIFDPVSKNQIYNGSYNTGGTLGVIYYASLSFGTVFTALYTGYNPTLGLYYTSVNQSSPPATLSPTLLVATNGSCQPDVVQSSSFFYVFYVNPSGQTVLSRYNSSYVLQNTVTVSSATATTLNLQMDSSGNIYAMYYDGTNTDMGIYSSTLTPIKPAANIITGVTQAVSGVTGVLVDSTHYYLYVQRASTVQGYYDTYVYSVNPSTLAATQIEYFYNCYLVTKAYLLNRKATVTLGFFDYEVPANSSIPLLEQATYFTVQQVPSASNYTLNIPYTVISKFAEGTAGVPLCGYGTNSSTGALTVTIGPPAYLSNVLTLSSTEVIVPYLTATQQNVSSNQLDQIFNVARLDQVTGTHTGHVSLGNNLNSTGGIITIFDGLGIAESGYHVFPSQTSVTFGTRTAPTHPIIVFGPSLTAGTYSYCVTYEWFDNYGNLHRSAPGASVIGTCTTTGTSNTQSYATILTNGISLSESYKIFNIQVVLWRTASNGTIFYRLGSAPNVAGQISFSDITPDAYLTDSTQLYTTGGEVDNIGPPASDIIFSYKNRLIAIEADNPYVWWYSKQVIQGFPVEFSDLFTSNIDMSGGPISAGATMDDKLIFFTETLIFYVIGDGPAPNGTQNDFSYPQVITSDVGCTNQHSIIVVPIGLIFQSTNKGLYLLDRTLQVSYIGAAVEAFNNIPISSACLLPNTTQVRFTLNNEVIIIYDYLVSQWSTHAGLTYVDSTIYKNQYTGLFSTGLVLEQTQNQWVDQASPVIFSMQTGWFKFGNLQGYQRVREFLILLTAVNATSISVNVAVNFDPTPIQTDVIPIPATTAIEEYRIYPVVQKCQSMQITITEVPTQMTGGGLIFSGLSFIMGVKKGQNKIPAANSYG